MLFSEGSQGSTLGHVALLIKHIRKHGGGKQARHPSKIRGGFRSIRAGQEASISGCNGENVTGLNQVGGNSIGGDSDPDCSCPICRGDTRFNTLGRLD